ncbi:MAG: minor capsid protein [Clostridia bacterium]|nr:minor capsid protein [Clostridia bacterium]
MARKPQGYFERRSTELMKRLEEGTENTIDSLIQVYNQATKNINKEINNIFKNYAKDTGLDKQTLTQLLSKRESEQYYKNLLEVINNNITDESIKKKLLAKYNAPAYSYRISRYQVLQDNIDLELKKLANVELDITKIRYVDTIKEGYYHTIYDIQKGTGLGFSFAQIDNRTINLMLNENWTNNANFSKRIWKNNEKLGEYLKVQLTAKEMSGKSIQKLSKELADYMNVGLFNATRLVRTEVCHFANESEMLSYEELDIDRYRFVATLDQVTCEECAKLDNKVFYVKDRKPRKKLCTYSSTEIDVQQ